MSVMPGLLDRRLWLYTRQDAGADGFSRPVYVYEGQYWGRIDAVSDQETVPLAPQGHVEYRTRARGTVADYVAIPLNGVIRVDGEGPGYWVRGTFVQRQIRARRIDLEAISPQEFVEFVGFEGLDTLDGVHLVKTPNGFSTGFDSGYS